MTGVLVGTLLTSLGCSSQRFEARVESRESSESGETSVASGTSSEPGSSWPASSDAGSLSSASSTGSSPGSQSLATSGMLDAGVSDGGDYTDVTSVTGQASDAGPVPTSDAGAQDSVSVSTEVALDASVVSSSEAAIDASVEAGSDAGPSAESSTASDETSIPYDPNACNDGDFGAPKLVLLGSDYTDKLWGPAISADGRTLLFGYTTNNEDLYQATLQVDRVRTFENVTPLHSLNTPDNEGTPFLSYDGLTLYFYSTRSGGVGDRDLWSASRTVADVQFGEPQLVQGLNGGSYDHLPWLSESELTIYYTTERDGGLGRSDIWSATRAAKTDPFSDVELVAGINSPDREDSLVLSPDRLTAYFTTDRSRGDFDIWKASRPSLASDFSQPVALDVLNSDSDDTNLALTHDGTRLYFSSGRDGAQQLWVAARTCPFRQ